jgi:hypothetical protein
MSPDPHRPSCCVSPTLHYKRRSAKQGEPCSNPPVHAAIPRKRMESNRPRGGGHRGARATVKRTGSSGLGLECPDNPPSRGDEPSRRPTPLPRRSFVVALPSPLAPSAPSSFPASQLPGTPRSPPPLVLGGRMTLPRRMGWNTSARGGTGRDDESEENQGVNRVARQIEGRGSTPSCFTVLPS